MDPNTKKVQWFCEYLQKGLSWQKKVVQLEKAQKLCNGVKNDLTTFEETFCHFGQTWNQSLQKNQVNSLEFCFKHHHHQVTVRFTQLLMHLFKVESIL